MSKIRGTQIKDESVTGDQILDDSISTDDIEDGTVLLEDLHQEVLDSMGGVFSRDSGTCSVVVNDDIGNCASANCSTISGGKNNTASNAYATVGGGSTHCSTGSYSTISGGYANKAIGNNSTVGGGNTNSACADRSTVGGGRQNTSSGSYSTISGGRSNSSIGSYAVVGGGCTNVAVCDYSGIVGGQNNTVCDTHSVAIGSGINVATDGTATDSSCDSSAYMENVCVTNVIKTSSNIKFVSGTAGSGEMQWTDCTTYYQACWATGLTNVDAREINIQFKNEDLKPTIPLDPDMSCMACVVVCSNSNADLYATIK